MSERKTNKKQTPPRKDVKAFFFLRHNNDIDHIVPVLHKWLSTENVRTDIIIPTSRELVDDYRIQYLKKYKNANIYFIADIFKKLSLEYLFNRFYFKYDTQSDILFKKVPIAKKIADRIIKRISNEIFKGAEGGVVVFDWIATYFTQKIVEIAKEKDFVTVSLPHGDRVYMSLMERINEISYDQNIVIDIFIARFI